MSFFSSVSVNFHELNAEKGNLFVLQQLSKFLVEFSLLTFDQQQQKH